MRGFLAFAFAHTALVAAVDLTKPVGELTLRDGRTLKNVSFIGYSPTAIVAKWDGGRGTISYDALPADVATAAKAMRPAPSTAKAPSAAPAPAKVAATGATKKSTTVAPVSRTVSGQVFVTTRGAGAYRFSGVRVSAYPAQIFDEVFSVQRANLPLGYRRLDAGEKEHAEAKSWMQALAPHTALAAATTDADGRYSMTIPSEGAVLVVASASRLVGTETEFNFWIVSHSGDRLDLTGQNTWSQPD